MWTASQNLGGAVIPLLAGGAAAAYGWRYGMLIPGATGLVAGVGLLMAVRNSPQVRQATGHTDAHTNGLAIGLRSCAAGSLATLSFLVGGVLFVRACVRACGERQPPHFV